MKNTLVHAYSNPNNKFCYYTGAANQNFAKALGVKTWDWTPNVPNLVEPWYGDTHTNTDVITDIAINTLENRDKTKPFCMLYHHKAPHRSWMPDITDFFLFEDVEFPVPDNFFDDYEGREAAAEADMKIRDMFFTWDMKLFSGQFEKESELGGRGNSEFDTELVLEIAKAWLDRMTPEQRKARNNYYNPRNNVFTELKLEGKELALWMYQRYMHDYLKCAASVDRNVGRVLDYLEEMELYDLENDPSEMNSLYGKEDYRQLVDSLRTDLESLRVQYKVE